MSDNIRPKSLGRRSLLRAILALPIVLAFRRTRPTQAAGAETTDDIVEINGWILRRSDLS